jgi:type IV secretion system protein VirB5
MIAAILARFIQDVRSIPADYVVFRENWLHAYAFSDKAGAERLSAYANQAKPFAQLGKSQVSVQVTSVVRASPGSFRVAWTETRYVDGQLADVERWSGILTVTVRPPDSLKGLSPNPLGVFVTHLDWSKEF